MSRSFDSRYVTRLAPPRYRPVVLHRFAKAITLGWAVAPVAVIATSALVGAGAGEVVAGAWCVVLWPAGRAYRKAGGPVSLLRWRGGRPVNFFGSPVWPWGSGRQFYYDEGGGTSVVPGRRAGGAKSGDCGAWGPPAVDGETGRRGGGAEAGDAS